jgi:hypothetical protein
MTERVKLYTSLPPTVTRTIAGVEVGSAYLAECVRSWRRAGFDVVSLNGMHEFDEVVGRGYEVDCRKVSRDRPAIDDFLTAIRASQAPFAGIINADVLLVADPRLLTRAVDAADSMTLIERINVDSDDLRPTGQSCFGFDAFIFATAPLARIDPEVEFLFGHPWWDYWFPFAYVAAGGRLRIIHAPVLFHLQHPLKWKQEHFNANGRKVISCLRRTMGGLPDDIRTEIGKFSNPDEVSEAELGGFGSRCFAKLRAMAEPIEIRGQAGELSPLGAFVALLQEPQNRAFLGELDKAEARLLAVSELGRLIGQMSHVAGEEHIGSIEDARRVAERAAQILASRKASLSHFWALNVRSFRKRWRTQEAAPRHVTPAAEALGALARGAASMVAGLWRRGPAR